MRFFEGEDLVSITKERINELTGRTVKYLTEQDIDKPGRGYYFSRYNVITEAYKRNVIFENGGIIAFSDLREMVLMGEPNGFE